MIPLYMYTWASLVAQTIKNPLAMQDCNACRTRLSPWVGKTPLEEGIGTHSSIFAWRILWTEEPSGLQSMGSQRVRHN